MELDQFIADALTQIVKGVESAQKNTGKGAVNATSIKTHADSAPKGKYFTAAYNQLVQMVDFDIAVTVTDATTAEAGGKISIASWSIGGKGSVKGEEQTVSRIKFSIPVVLPTSGETPEPAH